MMLSRKLTARVASGTLLTGLESLSVEEQASLPDLDEAQMQDVVAAGTESESVQLAADAETLETRADLMDATADVIDSGAVPAQADVGHVALADIAATAVTAGTDLEASDVAPGLESRIGGALESDGWKDKAKAFMKAAGQTLMALYEKFMNWLRTLKTRLFGVEKAAKSIKAKLAASDYKAPEGELQMGTYGAALSLAGKRPTSLADVAANLKKSATNVDSVLSVVKGVVKAKDKLLAVGDNATGDQVRTAQKELNSAIVGSLSAATTEGNVTTRKSPSFIGSEYILVTYKLAEKEDEFATLTIKRESDKVEASDAKIDRSKEGAIAIIDAALELNAKVAAFEKEAQASAAELKKAIEKTPTIEDAAARAAYNATRRNFLTSVTLFTQIAVNSSNRGVVTAVKFAAKAAGVSSDMFGGKEEAAEKTAAA